MILDNDQQREILAHPAITLAEAAEVITLGLPDARKPFSPRAPRSCSTGRDWYCVVRLVSGDPFLDNAVADEAAACVRGGIDFEVVPGVSSLTAVPEYAGIDLIHAGGVQFASVTDGKFSKNGTAQWGSAATIVVSTVASMISGLVEAAKSAGRRDDHVVVTLHGEHRTDHLDYELGWAGGRGAVGQGASSDPVHVIIGAAAEQRHELSWYETKPLFGWRVLVPRTKDQAAPMVARLRTCGAHSEEVPTISVEPPRSPLQMDKAIRGLVEGRYEGGVHFSQCGQGCTGEVRRDKGWTLGPSPAFEGPPLARWTANSAGLGNRTGSGARGRAVRSRPGG